MKLSLVMMVSQPDTLDMSLYGIESAIGKWDEILIGAAPDLPDGVMQRLRSLPGAKIFPGTNKVSQAGEVRFNLFDNATGDYIANVDDDDIWTYFPHNELDGCDYCSGDAIFFYETDTPLPRWQKGSVQFIAGGVIDAPIKANLAAGSQWIVSRQAYQAVSSKIQRYWDFSDFRLIAHLLNSGARFKYVPKLFGIVRVRKWAYSKETWAEHVTKL